MAERLAVSRPETSQTITVDETDTAQHQVIINALLFSNLKSTN